jgi:hypothetical protein
VERKNISVVMSAIIDWIKSRTFAIGHCSVRRNCYPETIRELLADPKEVTKLASKPEFAARIAGQTKDLPK